MIYGIWVESDDKQGRWLSSNGNQVLNSDSLNLITAIYNNEIANILSAYSKACIKIIGIGGKPQQIK